MAKIDKLYINFAPNTILHRYNTNFIEYNNQIFSNNSHIHLRACDTSTSYNFLYPIVGLNIPKWDCILNCCSDFPGMNAPYLESSEQIDCVFPDSLH